jgi:Tol biopolymer transport system component
LKLRLATLLAIVVAAIVPAAAHATLAFDANIARPQVWVSPSDDPANAILVAAGLVLQVSPNGEFVAFQSQSSFGQTELIVYNVVTGGRRVLLTGLQGGETTFAWSPDSTMIAALGGGGEHGSNDLKKRILYVIGVGGGKTRIATGYFRGVSFSPDSTELVFGRAVGQGTPTFQPEPAADLVRARVGGGPTTTITRDHISSWPLWGPVGQIAFVKQMKASRGKFGTKNDLYVTDPDGHRARRLTDTKVEADGRIFPAAWSPSGSLLLANVEGLETNYAAIVDPVNGGERRISPLGRKEPFAGVAFSADEQSVLGYLGGVYAASAYRTIASVPIGGGRTTALKHQAFSPSWGG